MRRIWIHIQLDALMGIGDPKELKAEWDRWAQYTRNTKKFLGGLGSVIGQLKQWEQKLDES